MVDKVIKFVFNSLGFAIPVLVFAFTLTLFYPTKISAQTSINLNDFIAGVGFREHDLSSGEHIRFSSEGSCPTNGSPVRQYKNSNYEQFCVAENGTYRQEDTSWALLIGGVLSDVHCEGTTHKAVYTSDPGCTTYTSGDHVYEDGAWWAPSNIILSGSSYTWSTTTPWQIVTIDLEALQSKGEKRYCNLAEEPHRSNYMSPKTCGQSLTIKVTYYAPGEYEFCTGLKNDNPLITLGASEGPGSDEQIAYMQGWGIVGFRSQQMEVGLMGTDSFGNTANPSGCSVSPTGTGPTLGELSDACDYDNSVARTKYPEFHSLRPYPACPWDSTIRDTQFYMCGQDLIATEQFEIRYNGSLPNNVSQESCTATPDGSSVTCNYVVNDRSIPINIDLSNADFPIMGLTEGPYINNSVDRAFNAPGRLTPAQKMNEYVSWYLNGVLFRAEGNRPVYYEGYPSKQEGLSDEEYQRRLEQAGEIINYTGPLNKLLPLRIQQKEREQEIDNADNSRHNQIAGCVYNVTGAWGIVDIIFKLSSVIGDITNVINSLGPLDYIVPDAFTGSHIVEEGIVGHCYPKADENEDGKIKSDEMSILKLPTIFLPDLEVEIQTKRLSEWKKHKPPKPENYSNSSDYWKDYQKWHGRFCPNLGLFYFCYDEPGNNTLRPNWYGNLFPYIPYSSTEDRVGFAQGYINFQASLPAQPPSDITITNVNFIPTGSSAGANDGAFRNLYFPHMQEVTELAQILQGTFIPFSEKPTWIDNPFEGGQTRGIYNTNRCEVIDSRTNPGDDLFGEISTTSDQANIQGEIKYSGTFSCTFTIPTPVCGGYAFPGQTHCNLDECVPYTCNTDGSWTPAGNVGTSPCSGTPGACISSSIYQQPEITPCIVRVQTALSNYVATPKVEEVYQRLVDGSMSIFKRIYPKIGPQTPAETIKDIPARTSATFTSTGENGQTYAGNPSIQRPGSLAKIYFPHIGSIYDYFLKGIQKALRPRGFGNFKPSTDPSTSEGDQENISCYPLTYELPFRDTSVVPKDVNSLIQYIHDHNLEMPQFSQEGLKRMATNLRRHYDTVVARAIEAGYNPAFVLAIWIEETGAGAFSNHDFGCGTSSGFDSQLNCFLGLYDFYSASSPSNTLFEACRQEDTPNFKEFLLFYSTGTCSTLQNQNFMRCSPYNWFGRFLWFYNAVVDQ